jgi:AhpD family alkylhydroperoxidase
MTLGFVPTFFKNYPKSGIAGAWKEMKMIEMNPNSAIPGEYKHLIGVAVSAQIPCTYCTYYHTKSAMMMNADKDEINEAVAMAAITREWSTVLNGNDIDEKKFKAETDKVMKFVKKQSSKEVTTN